MPPSQPPSSGRSTFLAVVLLTLFFAGAFVFCIGLMGQFFLAALAVVAVVGGIGLCHYLLWGRALSRDTEAERGRELLEDEIHPDANGWPTDGPPGPRRF
jgi:Flp pilus assembly protein TadB